jgi:hypothetical protein
MLGAVVLFNGSPPTQRNCSNVKLLGKPYSSSTVEMVAAGLRMKLGSCNEYSL